MKDKPYLERSADALEAVVEQNKEIICELKKVVEGNRSIFDQLRKIRSHHDEYARTHRP